MSIELKIAVTALFLFFLTAPIAALSIGTRWCRIGLTVHYSPLAVAFLSIFVFAMRRLWA